MSAPVNGDVVSTAIVAYLGSGRGPHPSADAQAVADLADRHGISAVDLARAVEQAIAAANTLRVDESATDAGPRFESRLRALLPSLDDAAVTALTSRAFWYARWDGGEPPSAHIAPHSDGSADRSTTGDAPGIAPHSDGSADRSTTGHAPDNAPRSDGATNPSATRDAPEQRQYWRHSTTLGTRYFASSGGRDFVLRDGAWQPYDVYKSGPSWWWLTGEIDAAVVERSELPPGTPD